MNSLSTAVSADCAIGRTNAGLARRRIVVIFSNPTCLNLGDVAMLQVAVKRLRALWPEAAISVMTSDPSELRKHCPAAEPLLYADEWLSDRLLAGRLQRFLPSRVSDRLSGMQHRLWHSAPGMMRALHGSKLQRAGSGEEFSTFLKAVQSAYYVVACGAGGLNDRFRSYANTLLITLDLAQATARGTAMFSHGLGPIHKAGLMSRASRILPRLNLIALRERVTGAPLLEKMRVNEERVHVTGDDAVSLAFAEARPDIGNGLGVNFRLGGSSEIEARSIESLGPIVRAFARERRATLIPLPIALQGDLDVSAIRAVVSGSATVREDALFSSTVTDVVRNAGHCRLVVTAAYHAAVFALSQGVPAVCLAGSDYFRAKFTGLADQFGIGCTVIDLQSAQPAELARTLAEFWNAAPTIRPLLLTAAARQERAGRRAYEQFRETAESSAASRN